MVEIGIFDIKNEETRGKVRDYLSKISSNSIPDGDANFMYFIGGRGHAYLEWRGDDGELVTLNIGDDIIKSLEQMLK